MTATATHAAAYTQSGRDTGHALCGDAAGPVSTDWDNVDCEPCICIHQSPAGDESDDGFAEWHTDHRARITGLQRDARAVLFGAIGQILAARRVLNDLLGERCEFDCACLDESAHRDVETFLADAERMLRIARAMTRPETAED